MAENLVQIAIDSIVLEGNLNIPEGTEGIVLFAHGSGSSRLSPRNNFVAQVLNKAGIATLLMDLLTEEEDKLYENRFDIDLLTKRLLATIRHLKKESETKNLNIGLFGSSTGAAAALKVAAMLGKQIGAVVSRGGRPDLAYENLNLVASPTLLIVGGNDTGVLELNQKAYEGLKSIKKLKIIPGATHLFEEPGALEKVAEVAKDWFKKYLLVPGAGFEPT